MYTMETERLVLRGVQETDRGPLIEMLASPSVTKLLFGGVPMNVHEAALFMDRHFTFGQSATGIGVLREKGTDHFVGFAGLLPCRYLGVDDFEIGAAFVEDAWHKGYGTEVGLAEISYGLGKLRLPRLLALAHPDNIYSIKAIERLGMTFVREINTETRGPRRVYVINRMDE